MVSRLPGGDAARRLWALVDRRRQALERSERLNRTALDAMEAGIVLYDADDRLVLCNRDFRELYGPIAALLKPGMFFEEAFSTDVTDLVRRERELERMVAERDHLAEALGRANERLEALSETDALTGIANRRQFDRRLREECQRARRHRWPLALLMVDVDHFKRYNDLHGHPAGDECLRRVAAVLSGCAHRPADLTARYGGEEFALLLPHTPLREAGLIAERCLQAVDRAAIAHGDSPVSPQVTLSIGVAALRGPTAAATGPQELVADADHALYLAKSLGRHRVANAEDAADSTVG